MEHGLTADIIDWLETAGGGALCRSERHVARREAWLVAMEQADGQVLEGFLRLERDAPASDNISLTREVNICRALQHTDVPVPGIIAWNPEQRLALFERVAGTAAIDKLDDAAVQPRVMEDFIDAIARLHQLPPADLNLEQTLGTYALSARRAYREEWLYAPAAALYPNRQWSEID